MTDEPLVFEQVIHASTKKVWEAITDAHQMKQWYFNIAAFEPDPGFEFSFLGGDENQSFLHLCKITTVVTGKKLGYTWQYEGHEKATLVTFELFDEGENTRIRVTHEGLAAIAGYGPAFAAGNFKEGWTYIIGTSLKNYLEAKEAK